MRRHRHKLNSEQALRLAAYLRGHPALELIYRFKQRLCYLLLKKLAEAVETGEAGGQVRWRQAAACALSETRKID